MATENLGASFTIDITDLQAGLNQANRLIRESESQFQAAAAGMEDWSSSQEGLTARIGSLNDQIELQREKVRALNAQKENIIKTMTEEGKSQEEIDIAIDSVNKKIAQEGKQLSKLEGEVKKNSTALDKMENETEEAEKSMDGFGKTIGGAVLNGLKAVGTAAAGLVTSFFGLAEATRETRDQTNRMATAFDSAGWRAEAGERIFTDLTGVIGDAGKAAETTTLLASFLTDELITGEEVVRGLTGVYATYGEAIPLEGLAEAMNHTAKLGEVQGNLADALEWAGVSVEDFNKQLATYDNEGDRAIFITETLNGLYGDAADSYNQMNADIIAANEAQATLTATLAELGAIAEPIMTTLKNLASELLQEILPFVKMMGEGLGGALAGTAGAADKLAEGLSGIIDTAVQTVNDMLPMVVEVIAQLIPSILVTIINALPQLVQTIADGILLIVNTLGAMLPQIITAIANALPQIINTIVAMIPQLITSLLSFLPQLLSAAITLLMSLVRAIPTVIVELVNALPSIITATIDAIVGSIPLLLQAGIDLLMAIVDAIPVIIDALIEALPQIIDAIISGVLEALPLLLDAAITLFFAIIDAIPVIVGMLIQKLPQIITTILTSLTNALPQLFSTAKTLFNKIIEAVGELITSLPSKMTEVCTTIVSGITEGWSSVKEAGKDLIRGLWEGISDMTQWLADKLTGFGDAALGALKNFFGIASPSRLMADVVGKNIALGIGQGFEDNIADVNKQITGSIDVGDTGIGVGAENGTGGLASGSNGGVVINQYNNYSQAHSRYEIYRSQQQTVSAVKLALGGA